MGITIDNSAARIAARHVAQNRAAVGVSLQRLSTGFRINSGKDDPAGLIASELLRSEKAQVTRPKPPAAVDSKPRGLRASRTGGTPGTWPGTPQP